MAEIIGALVSGLTLASLFKASIEAFDHIQAARNQEIGSEEALSTSQHRKLLTTQLGPGNGTCGLFDWSY
jgi:hypothetical protein